MAASCFQVRTQTLNVRRGVNSCAFQAERKTRVHFRSNKNWCAFRLKKIVCTSGWKNSCAWCTRIDPSSNVQQDEYDSTSWTIFFEKSSKLKKILLILVILFRTINSKNWLLHESGIISIRLPNMSSEDRKLCQSFISGNVASAYHHGHDRLFQIMYLKLSELNQGPYTGLDKICTSFSSNANYRVRIPFTGWKCRELAEF